MAKRGQRTAVVSVLMTPADKSRMEAAAEAEGRAISDYCRRAILAALDARDAEANPEPKQQAEGQHERMMVAA